jgi:hypothetical protein
MRWDNNNVEYESDADITICLCVQVNYQDYYCFY